MSRSHRRLARTLIVPLAVAGLAGTLVGGLPAEVAEARPRLTVSTVASGLTNPWDITWVGSLMLYNERTGAVWSKSGSAAPKRVSAPLTDLYAKGEGGLMGMVADPAAATNKRLYVCYASQANGRARDVRVVRWRLTSDTKAVVDGSRHVVIDGLPLNTSGRHSGCRLRFGPDGLLYVGTGDAAVSANPQRKTSLGGKVLRVRPDGGIPSDNPYAKARDDSRYVWSYGHRNVQGLAFRPGTSQLWSAEHGSYRDDEVNLIARGANYGWDPGPGYDERVPMTDTKKYPSARRAVWSSGDPTVATGGLTFLADASWGRWQGAVAVGLLKARGIKLLYLDPASKQVTAGSIAEASRYGRIRTVQYGPDRALWFTTSNGGGKDVVGRIAPTATPPRVAPGTNISPVAPSGVRTDGDLYAFVRTTDNRIAFKRSTDDGRRWPSAWTGAGVTSTAAPSVASSARGRVDLATRNADGSITHTWLVDGKRRGSTNLGGRTTNATISSLGNGTLDVWQLSRAGNAWRRHYDGRAWGPWQRLSGGPFTSAIGASPRPASGTTLITARGERGATLERVATASSDGAGWKTVPGELWSGRALGDRFPDRPTIAMSRSYDGMARWQQGGLTMVLEWAITSDPDVVTRPDGTWVALARDAKGGLSVYDGRPGAYAARSLGGTVR